MKEDIRINQAKMDATVKKMKEEMTAKKEWYSSGNNGHFVRLTTRNSNIEHRSSHFGGGNAYNRSLVTRKTEPHNKQRKTSREGQATARDMKPILAHNFSN
jgi:hypothetical protein